MSYHLLRERSVVTILSKKMEKIIAFFKPPDPKQLAKQWQSNIRKEQRRIDANINDIKRECAKTTREIKTCLKRQDVQSARVLAKEIAKARRTMESLYETKANYNSISMRLGESVGRLAQAGSVKTSAEILKSMNAIANVGQATKDVVAMSKEMFKLGVIEDVLEDAFAGMASTDDEEEETERVTCLKSSPRGRGCNAEKVVEQPKTTGAVARSASKKKMRRHPVVVDVCRLPRLREKYIVVLYRFRSFD